MSRVPATSNTRGITAQILGLLSLFSAKGVDVALNIGVGTGVSLVIEVAPGMLSLTIVGVAVNMTGCGVTISLVSTGGNWEISTESSAGEHPPRVANDTKLMRDNVINRLNFIALFLVLSGQTNCSRIIPEASCGEVFLFCGEPC